METDRCFPAQAHNTPVADAAFDASGGCIGTASSAREVKVWDVDAGCCTHSLVGHAGVVMRVLFHPRWPLLATAGDDGVIIIWDLPSKKLKFKLTGHVSTVTAIDWAGGGQFIVSAGRDKVAVLWDVTSGSKIRSIAIHESIETLVVLSNGIADAIHQVDPKQCSDTVFATGGEAGAVKIWNAGTGRCVLQSSAAVLGYSSNSVVNLSAMPGSQTILKATADCTIEVMHVSQTCLQRGQVLLGNLGEVTSVTILDDSDVKRIEGISSPAVRETEMAERPSAVAVATNSSRFCLLSCSALQCKRVFEGHGDIVLCIAATYLVVQGLRIYVIASGSKDNTIRLWHVPTGRCLATASGHLGSVSAVTVSSHDTPFVLSGGADKLIQTWSLSKLWQILEAGKLPQQPLDLSALAVVAAHEKEVNCVAVSPFNNLAASGGADRKARVWKLPALSQPIILVGHKRGVWDVQFAPVEQV